MTKIGKAMEKGAWKIDEMKEAHHHQGELSITEADPTTTQNKRGKSWHVTCLHPSLSNSELPVFFAAPVGPLSPPALIFPTHTTYTTQPPTRGMGPSGASETAGAGAGATIEVLRFLHEEVQVSHERDVSGVPVLIKPSPTAFSTLSSSVGPLAAAG